MMLEKTDTPKLFYTPEELSINTDIDYTFISFGNSPLVPSLKIDDNGNIGSQIKVTNVMYVKIYFRNARYDYVWVMEKAKDLFMEIYSYES